MTALFTGPELPQNNEPPDRLISKGFSVVFDSGATEHLVNDERLAEGWTIPERPIWVGTAGGGTLAVAKVGGTARWRCLQASTGKWEHLLLKGVMLVPDLITNLVGMRSLTMGDGAATFERGVVTLKDGAGGIATVPVDDRYTATMRLHAERERVHVGVALIAQAQEISKAEKLVTLWHRRCGHPGHQRLVETSRTAIEHDIPDGAARVPCEACVIAKSKVHPSVRKRSLTRKGEVVSLDLIVGLRGNDTYHHVLLIVDNWSGYTWVYALKTKSGAQEAVRQWLRQCQAAGVRVDELRMDQGGEVWNAKVQSLGTELGMKVTAAPTGQSTSNSIAERAIQSVETVARTLMHQMRVPETFWPEAFAQASYAMVRLASSSRGGKTPYELWFNRPPSLAHLRVFGCVCFVVLNKTTKSTWSRSPYLSKHLRPRAVRGLYLGYSDVTGAVKGHRAFLPSLQRVVVVRDMRWEEDKSYEDSRGEDQDSKSEDYFLLPRPPTGGEHGDDDDEEDDIPRLPAFSRQRKRAERDDVIPLPGDGDETFAHYWDEMQEARAESGERMELELAEEHAVREMEDGTRAAEVSEDEAPGEASGQEPEEEGGESESEESEDPINFLGPSSYSYLVRQLPSIPPPADASERMALAAFVAEATAAAGAHHSPDGTPLEPASLKEAKTRPDWPQWRQAMDEEMEAMHRMHVWDQVKIPAGVKPVGAKWVFKRKLDEHGTPTRYKARLVAQGYSQLAGVDFDQTFAPVARIQSLRLLLAVARHFRLFVHSMDVSTAFLNGAIDRDVFLAIAPDFEDSKASGTCYKLRKAIYGLKQAGRQWHLTLHKQLTSFGYRQLRSEPCLYVRGEGSAMVLVLVYVDDLAIATARESTMSAAKQQLKSSFTMTDGGSITHMLGIRIQYDRDLRQCRMDQSAYIRAVCERLGVGAGKRVTRPCDDEIAHLEPEKERIATKTDITTYAGLVGCLLWVAGATRPDIAYAVGRLAKFMSNPNDVHLKAAKKVFDYLLSTHAKCLTFEHEGPAIAGWADSDWAGDHGNRRSTSGYAFKVFGALVSWSSTQQSTVALSSVEAEYVALSGASREAVWLSMVMHEIGVTAGKQSEGVGVSTTGSTHVLRSREGDLTVDAAVPILASDSSGARAIATNPESHKRTKHISNQD